MATVHKKFRKAIRAADKYLRNKKYVCLFPGCKEKAIRSHAIPGALCIEALAENGVVYTMEQSFNAMMTMTAVTDPIDVVTVRPPAVRAEATAPRIIRLTPNDFVRTVTEMPDFIIQAFVPN